MEKKRKRERERKLLACGVVRRLKKSGPTLQHSFHRQQPPARSRGGQEEREPWDLGFPGYENEKRKDRDIMIRSGERKKYS